DLTDGAVEVGRVDDAGLHALGRVDGVVLDVEAQVSVLRRPFVNLDVADLPQDGPVFLAAVGLHQLDVDVQPVAEGVARVGFIRIAGGGKGEEGEEGESRESASHGEDLNFERFPNDNPDYNSPPQVNASQSREFSVPRPPIPRIRQIG